MECWINVCWPRFGFYIKREILTNWLRKVTRSSICFGRSFDISVSVRWLLLLTTVCDNDDGRIHGHVGLWRSGRFSRDGVNFATVPDWPNPADEQNWGGQHLEKTNQKSATVPATAFVAVWLKHGSDTWENDVKDKYEAWPGDWVYVFVAAHLFKINYSFQIF